MAESRTANIACSLPSNEPS